MSESGTGSQRGRLPDRAGGGVGGGRAAPGLPTGVASDSPRGIVAADGGGDEEDDEDEGAGEGEDGEEEVEGDEGEAEEDDEQGEEADAGEEGGEKGLGEEHGIGVPQEACRTRGMGGGWGCGKARLARGGVGLEIRDFASLVLGTESLEVKLTAPAEELTDELPGPAVRGGGRAG